MTKAHPQTSPDPRRATRFAVNFDTICETPKIGEFSVQISNISAHGMMMAETVELNKGDRIVVRLPVAGRIEAFLVWSHRGRCGFEFERIICQPDFMAMIDKINHPEQEGRRPIL